MNYKYILAIDPSGSFDEGRGKTGWVLMEAANKKIIDIGFLDAGKYLCAAAYWDEHIQLIDKYIDRYGKDMIIVIEEYTLYADRAQSQTNSKMETCRVLGVIQHHCWECKQNYSMQPAHSVVNRWNDTVLLHKGIIKQAKHRSQVLGAQPNIYLNAHMKDALRHALHYANFRNGRKERHDF